MFQDAGEMLAGGLYDELPAHPLHVVREVFFTIDDGEGVGPVMQVRTPIGAPGGAHAAAAARPAHARAARNGFADIDIAALVGG